MAALIAMAEPLARPPVLSTPGNHILQEHVVAPTDRLGQVATDQQLRITYEIARTLREIRKAKWTKVALQFPDHMLRDAPRVSQALTAGLKEARPGSSEQLVAPSSSLNAVTDRTTTAGTEAELTDGPTRFYILGDTSYGACCVDEIAAEHVNADAVVHYGRACLSPTVRLPVVHVFTHQPLAVEPLLQAFKELYPHRDSKILLMADVTYSSHLSTIFDALQQEGYGHAFLTQTVHSPSSPLPNRTVPKEAEEDPARLKDWQLFHISEPPQSLLLTLSSRVSQIHIYPTSHAPSTPEAKPLLASTAIALKKRYALLTSVSSVPIFGILINTLSVKNYLHIVEHVKSQILAAGKKSYTFVVGKINAAKVANFSEIGAWVVIGCWESSLVESKDFWRPLLTPFELDLALKKDHERFWTGEWSSDFQQILNHTNELPSQPDDFEDEVTTPNEADPDSEPESAPPEFDLRTGRYVSNSRPMQPLAIHSTKPSAKNGTADLPDRSLAKRPKGDLAYIGNEISPGAQYLKSNRTWKGLGSDFEIAYDEPGAETGAVVEEGRSGIARGYVHGGAERKT